MTRENIAELPFHGFCWSNIIVLLQQWSSNLKMFQKRQCIDLNSNCGLKHRRQTQLSLLKQQKETTKATKKIALLEGNAPTMIEDKGEIESNLADEYFEKNLNIAETSNRPPIQVKSPLKNEIADGPVRQCSLSSKFLPQFSKCFRAHVKHFTPVATIINRP